MLKQPGILATKVGMTQLFVEDGVRVPVTVLQLKENIVLEKKTKEQDGYDAVQLGYDDIREKLLNKPKKGFFQKKKLPIKRHIKEFRLEESNLALFEVGQKVALDWLKEGSSVDISGVSKGKGFAGVMKRHGFAGFPGSRGTHETFRGGGSIGNRAVPGRVFKGKRMAGHMGCERVTVKNLRVIRFLEDEQLLCIRGGIPGGKGALVEVRLSLRKPKAVPGIAGPKEEKALKNPMKASKAGAKK